MIRSIIQVTSLFVFILLALYFESPPEAQGIESTGFSAERAFVHIEKLADKVHFMGSDANKEKRDVIIEEFRKMGYDPEVFIGESKNDWGSRFLKAKTENILVTKKGTKGDKKVVVMGHYDSVINSPGAADDVHSVACMLDVANLIKDQNFENDILFLITDGEEMGLFGASAYADTYDLSSIGVLLNFEARGNSGPAYAFEWSENNFWLVQALKGQSSRPIANSLSFEVYNRMPNGSDFTAFKDKGVPGINHAFIDGFTYYHSPEDTPENINLNSVQHNGDYMYNLTTYFGDQDLSFEHKGNATFFNLYSGLIVYRPYVDLILLILTVGMIILLLSQWLRKKELAFKSFIPALLFNVLMLVLAVICGMAIEWLIKIVYPHYFQFYAGQFYNHKAYLVVVVGLALILQGTVGKKIYGFLEHKAYMSSVIVLWLSMTIGIYFAASTAAYLLLWPLFFLVAVYVAIEFIPSIGSRPWASYLWIIPLAVTAGLWTVAIHSLFLAFSLTMLTVPLALLVLLFMLMPVLLEDVWKDKRLLTYLGTTVTLLALIYGHLTSTATASRPLPSHLDYLVDQNDSTAYWISNNKEIDEGNSGVLQGAEMNEVSIPWLVKRWALMTDLQPFTPIEVQVDSTGKDYSFVNNALQTFIKFDNMEGVEMVTVNEDIINTDKGKNTFYLTLYGYSGDTIDIKLDKPQDVLPELTISFYNEGLPRKDILPDNYMRTGGQFITTYKLEN